MQRHGVGGVRTSDIWISGEGAHNSAHNTGFVGKSLRESGLLLKDDDSLGHGSCILNKCAIAGTFYFQVAENLSQAGSIRIENLLAYTCEHFKNKVSGVP